MSYPIWARNCLALYDELEKAGLIGSEKGKELTGFERDAIDQAKADRELKGER